MVYSSNGGKPNSSGRKCSIESSMRVASGAMLRSNRGSGTITTCMPAATAARTPFSESSNIKHWNMSKRTTQKLRLDKFYLEKTSQNRAILCPFVYFLFALLLTAKSVTCIKKKMILNGESIVQTTKYLTSENRT